MWTGYVKFVSHAPRFLTFPVALTRVGLFVPSPRENVAVFVPVDKFIDGQLALSPCVQIAVVVV